MLSALMIIYNEEKLLERALKSIKDIVDEIIIIHDGKCKDNSLNIARRYTDKIYCLKHEGIGEYHYIEGLKKCSHPFILKLDADEYLSPEVQDYIKNKEYTKYDTVMFTFPVWTGTEYLCETHPYKGFIFRKSEIKFIKMPAYNFFTSKKVKVEKIMVHHKPYNNYLGTELQKEKHHKWALLHVKNVFTNTYSKETYNMSDKELDDIEFKRLLFIKYPWIVFIVILYQDILTIINNINILHKSGFWKLMYSSFDYYLIVFKEIKKYKIINNYKY